MMAITLILLGLMAGACYNPENPQELDVFSSSYYSDRSTQVAAFDAEVGDLNDPVELEQVARADILIAMPWQCWDANLDLDKIRAAHPGIKIIAYFRPSTIRKEWADAPEDNYTRQLYEAALPYLSYTTTGDTLATWPGVYTFNFLEQEARQAEFQVFQDFQASSQNKFDGIFYDYFPSILWVPGFLTDMDGDPDMDGDGIPHRDDPDEIQAFLDAEDAWVDEVRAAMGEGFIQIANGRRAPQDSVFAAKFDGSFYEDFPGQGWNGTAKFHQALDPAVPNNLFAARHWFRTNNGGPWLMLSQKNSQGTYFDSDLNPHTVDGGQLARVVAMLVDGTAMTYDGSGDYLAGIPSVEYDLGPALGGVTINGDVYTREFRDGTVELTMRTGNYPFPFNFRVYRKGAVIDQSEFPTWDP